MRETGTIYKKKKVVLVGAGFVGSTIAYALMMKNLAEEIVLVDANREKAVAEALDIQHGISFLGVPSVRAGGYEDCADANLVIVAAGRNRKPGENRLDLLSDNIAIMRTIADQIRPFFNRGVLLVVSNPVDILTYKLDKWLGLANGHVFGTGCVLDTSRLVYGIAEYAGLNIEMVKCDIVGEHGDAQFPVWSRLTVGGIPITEYCEATGLEWGKDQKNEIYQRVKKMGATIIAGKGRTHYGIATCVCLIADAILNQRPTILSVSSTFHGEYGIEDVAMSVPSIVGVNGVEFRPTYKWQENEYSALQASGDKLKKILRTI